MGDMGPLRLMTMEGHSTGVSSLDNLADRNNTVLESRTITMDSLSDVAVFVQVVQSGSFTAAAERLQVSKSVVSKYVSRLENRLGARLLNRTTRRLSLTEVGRVFYERSRDGLNAIEEAELEVSRMQGAPTGTLRLNTPMSFGVLHVAPALPDFMRQFPEISVEVNLDDRMVDVIEEGFDISVRISELPDSSLVARRLATCRHAVVAAPSYLERHGSPTRAEDLTRHNVISYRYQESALNWHFKAPDGKPVSIPVSGNLQMNNSLALREAMLAGVGIARTPTFLVGEDIGRGRLVPILTDYEALEVSIFLVYPQRRHLSPKVRAFIEFMADRIQDPPYWDAAWRG
jgi:DNA-binding transcriptional LysR family regulator